MRPVVRWYAEDAVVTAGSFFVTFAAGNGGELHRLRAGKSLEQLEAFLTDAINAASGREARFCTLQLGGVVLLCDSYTHEGYVSFNTPSGAYPLSMATIVDLRNWLAHITGPARPLPGVSVEPVGGCVRLLLDTDCRVRLELDDPEAFAGRLLEAAGGWDLQDFSCGVDAEGTDIIITSCDDCWVTVRLGGDYWDLAPFKLTRGTLARIAEMVLAANQKPDAGKEER